MISTTKQNWNRATTVFLIISIIQVIIEYVRRNETICCLVGFGIGVGCCILYRIISNLLTSSTKIRPSIISKYDVKTTLLNSNIKQEYNDDSSNNPISDETTWSEMSSSLSTFNIFHDSYHSNSLTGDSGVDCPEILTENQANSDDEHEIFLKKYDTQPNIISYISTEKGLERALEQTSRFYNDLEHIASDLGTLTKRYSQSHQSIDALDWDLNDDDIHSPKIIHRKQIRTNNNNNNNKIRRRINPNINQIEYNESDHDNRLFDYSTSPLRRKHSSVYFDSSDSTSDEENIGDETLQ